MGYFVGFLENLRHQKDILKLTDLSYCSMRKTHGIHHFGRQYEIRLFKKILGFSLNDVDVV